jgi:hypothetical protein
VTISEIAPQQDAFLLPGEPVPILYFGTFKPEPSVLYDGISKEILKDKIAIDQYQDQENGYD